MKKFFGIAASLVACLAFTAVASAEVTIDEDYTYGFIGRGDVISHPDLGKVALIQNPVISLEVSSITQTQSFKPNDNANQNAWKVATRTLGLTASVTLAYTKNAKGKNDSHVTGYVLDGDGLGEEESGTWMYVDDGEIKPVPSNWIAVGNIVDVSGEESEDIILTFTAGELSGSWIRTETSDGEETIVSWEVL